MTQKKIKVFLAAAATAISLMAGTVPAMANTVADGMVPYNFQDVGQETYHYYDSPVVWALEHGITNGTSSTQFGVGQPCTRAQMVTFLYNAAGKPSVSYNGEFSDVKASDFFANAVAWAVQNGITNGTGEGKFSPNAICTRGQVVKFLYSASSDADKTSATYQDNFKDVKASDFFAQATAWAVQNGITSGSGNGMFSPYAPCTREQAVTFLWRANVDTSKIEGSPKVTATVRDDGSLVLHCDMHREGFLDFSLIGETEDDGIYVMLENIDPTTMSFKQQFEISNADDYLEITFHPSYFTDFSSMQSDRLKEPGTHTLEFNYLLNPDQQDSKIYKVRATYEIS